MPGPLRPFQGRRRHYRAKETGLIVDAGMRGCFEQASVATIETETEE